MHHRVCFIHAGTLIPMSKERPVSVMAWFRFRGRGKSSIFDNTVTGTGYIDE